MRTIFPVILFLISIAGGSYAQQLDLPATKPGCNQSGVVLDAGAGFDSYSWSTGETTQSITVEEDGMYFVTVNSESGMQTDSTFVEFLNYQIVPDQDTTLCYGQEFQMHVVPEIYDVVWEPGNVTNDSLLITATEEQTFETYITGERSTCVESSGISLHPRLFVDIDVINKICAGTDNGQVIASVTGGKKPYEFLWDGYSLQWDSIARALIGGEHELEITDDNGCKLDTTFTVETYPPYDVEITSDPSDTIYIDNPTITFGFENNADYQITNWKWINFGDGDTSTLREPVHTFEGVKGTNENPPPSEYVVKLELSNEYGCDTIITKEMPIEEAELKIPNVMTPNGDGFNDTFIIKNEKTGNDITIEYERVEFLVYNRYGKVVYKDDNYMSDWKAKGLSDGTYFYVIRTYGYFRNDDYQGAITIIGSSN